MAKSSIILKISDVSKKYGSCIALDSVNLEVRHKDFYALLGANGAGKTTLIGIITDLIKASSGRIIINNLDLQIQTALAKQNVGVVPQEINLNVFETVEQTLLQQAQYYGVKASLVKGRADYLLQKLHLSDKKHNRVSHLSGGMKRRLMIARAMIHSPSLLLLDEPTAGVDVEVRKSLWDFLKQENENGLTIVLTTHYLEEAEMLCNRVGMMKKGKSVFEGDMSELLSELEGEIITVEVDKENLSLTKELQEQCNNIKGNNLEIHMHRGQPLQEIIEQINKSGGNIIRVEHKSGRLEQVFKNKLGEKNV
jgi:ABC-2 type transport system ATP-binding protein